MSISKTAKRAALALPLLALPATATQPQILEILPEEAQPLTTLVYLFSMRNGAVTIADTLQVRGATECISRARSALTGVQQRNDAGEYISGNYQCLQSDPQNIPRIVATGLVVQNEEWRGEPAIDRHKLIMTITPGLFN